MTTSWDSRFSERVSAIKERIKAAQDELDAVQLECPHPQEHLSKESWSNRGNYDPSTDCWGYKYHCQLCDKRWTEVKE